MPSENISIGFHCSNQATRRQLIRNPTRLTGVQIITNLWQSCVTCHHTTDRKHQNTVKNKESSRSLLTDGPISVVNTNCTELLTVTGVVLPVVSMSCFSQHCLLFHLYLKAGRPRISSASPLRLFGPLVALTNSNERTLAPPSLASLYLFYLPIQDYYWWQITPCWCNRDVSDATSASVRRASQWFSVSFRWLKKICMCRVMTLKCADVCV